MTTKPLDRLMFAQGGLCFFCKQPLPKAEASVEHLLATAKGGGNNLENCVACCKSVNVLLGSMSLKEKIQVILNQKGHFKCPNNAGTESVIAPPKMQPKVPTGTKSKTDFFQLVVTNLMQRGNARPRTIKTLTSTVASLLPKGLPESQIAAVIQQLQVMGKVSISENKITYDL